jgi:hypothetical protein
LVSYLNIGVIFSTGPRGYVSVVKRHIPLTISDGYGKVRGMAITIHAGGRAAGEGVVILPLSKEGGTVHG